MLSTPHRCVSTTVDIRCVSVIFPLGLLPLLQLAAGIHKFRGTPTTHTTHTHHLSFSVTHSAKPITFYVTSPKTPRTQFNWSQKSSAYLFFQWCLLIIENLNSTRWWCPWRWWWWRIRGGPGRCSCAWSWESGAKLPLLFALATIFVCFGHKAELSSALNARGFVGWMEKRRRLIGK